MKARKTLFLGLFTGFLSQAALAQERLELESIYIKGSNKEFPQILYIVPWKDMKLKGHREQTLVLHSLFGDLFDPVYGKYEKLEAPVTQKKR